MSAINQKEYLKKYLGLGKKSGDKKKKKKTKKVAGKGLKIVDDDIDVNLNEEIKVDLTADNEDAPQIVSIIDDRPPSLRIDEKTKDHLWQPIGDVVTRPKRNLIFGGSIKFSKNVDGAKSLLKKIKSIKPSKNIDYSPPRKSQRTNSTDSDNSPPRYKKTSADASPERKDGNSNSDASPPRRHHRSENNEDISSPIKVKRESSYDNSPSRGLTSEHNSPLSRKDNDDSSPPRKIERKKSLDNSPPRRRRNEISPLRREDDDISPPRKIKREKTPDNSPPRRHRRENSPPRKKLDNSPPRRHRKDISPSRRAKLANDSSPSRRIKTERIEDNSPARRNKKSRWAENEPEDGKLKKTLDGKTAGLQNAANLVLETQALKKREDELFKSMSADVSGANAATIVRSKKKKEVDWEEEERKRKREEENKEKYNKWGKGLKQVEDINEKIKSDLHEMSKPLARYADDEDLEKYLKEQERDGDPMLAYLRQKKKKKHIEEGKPVTQQYQGDAPPNRFGIRPGYRWDGVDRSSGYEKQWFQIQNSRQASVEETYKWSTEDM